MNLRSDDSLARARIWLSAEDHELLFSPFTQRPALEGRRFLCLYSFGWRTPGGLSAVRTAERLAGLFRREIWDAGTIS